jgi:hypothetical protein
LARFCWKRRDRMTSPSPMWGRRRAAGRRRPDEKSAYLGPLVGND